MERHKCKLCFRSFYNGKALGGHMRSHMMNLPVSSKPEEEKEDQIARKTTAQLSEEAESASSIPSSSEEEVEEEEEGDKGLYYELRENPKRSFRLVDPEFSFTVDAGSVVLQDRESETDSSKNPTRRRSKRTRKLGIMIKHHHHHQYHTQKYDEELEAIKKIKLNKPSKTESWVEPEPMSSVSDATTEEDVAYCLMMLSRDKWKKQDHEEQEQEDERSTDESEELKTSKVRTRGKYKCDTCKKIFKSYQALGGHRASHKKNMKLVSNYNNSPEEPELDQQENAGTSTSVAEKKIHECPICFRVFSSGQALGGHKRSHVIGSSSATNSTTRVKSFTKLEDKDCLIDLNLPAPVDDDGEISQIELSAVSDAEFVNPIKLYSKFSH